MKKILLISILILASFLRLWELGSVPVSPDWDEAALGYNAYSILHTGKDEHGEFFPVVLKSFNDYKPAFYAYLGVPAIKVFGLNVFSVRLPSAIFGILTVFASYFLVKELFKRTDIALLAAFLLAISPWHIQFSRVAFESNIGLSFNIFTALFFLKGLKSRWLLPLSGTCASLSIYSYQSEKVFTPLLVLSLIAIYRKELFQIPKKYLAAAIIAGLITIAPLVFYTIGHPQSLSRATSTLAFSNKSFFLQQSINRLQYDKDEGNLIGKVFDNRRAAYLKAGIGGYLSHFDLNWLFIKGDIPRHHAPGMGLLYLWELPFVLIGIYSLIFYKTFSKKSKQCIFAWLLIAPIPAALTADVPHAVRTLNFLPTFQIFIAIGIITSIVYISKIKYQIAKIKIKYLIFILYLLFFIFNISYYLNQYFVQQDYFYSKEWQYGYREAVQFVRENENKYKRIVVSNVSPLDQSHIFFLFYGKYPPQEYIKNSQKIPKYEFRPIDWSTEEKNATILYIGRPGDFGNNAKVIKTINYINGETAIKIVEG